LESDYKRIVWRTATTCESGACVEVARLDELVLVRDGKEPDGAVLRFSVDEWRRFVAGVRAGDFDV
jgi:Domain of unknown function (DUF397)